MIFTGGIIVTINHCSPPVIHFIEIKYLHSFLVQLSRSCSYPKEVTPIDSYPMLFKLWQQKVCSCTGLLQSTFTNVIHQRWECNAPILSCGRVPAVVLPYLQLFAFYLRCSCIVSFIKGRRCHGPHDPRVGFLTRMCCVSKSFAILYLVHSQARWHPAPFSQTHTDCQCKLQPPAVSCVAVALHDSGKA
jgi:hypothetical protein